MESLYVFTLLNLLDIMTTRAALERGGYEANPVARWFLKRMGYPGLFLLKYATMALVILAGHIQGDLELGIWINNIVLSCVVAWNSFVNYRLGVRPRR